jgi:uncharacterized membrane protein
MAERLRSSLWFIPTLFGGGAFLLAALTLIVDREIGSDEFGFLLFGGTADGAREVLSTIAQSMLTFTALVFTITMLVLQLASSQLSPRVIRTFLRDLGNQLVLGLFIATFLYTLLVLRDVRSPDAGDEFVPGLSVFAAFLLLIASVGAFIYYINHMAHAIRATTVLDNIADETRSAIDRLFPESLGREPEVSPAPVIPPQSADDRLVPATSSGALVNVDEGGLFRTLKDGDAFVEVLPMVGDYVPEGAPLFRIRRAGERDLADGLRDQVTLGSERTLQQDAAFGFRQIVDIGVRALSPGTNDPSTAVQAIDRLHDLLRRLVDRSFPSAVRVDDEGEARLIVPRPEWSDYVRLAVDELRIAGTGQLQVMRRLRAVLEDLEAVAPAERRQIISEELQQLDIAAASGFDSDADRDRARRPSPTGNPRS